MSNSTDSATRRKQLAQMYDKMVTVSKSNAPDKLAEVKEFAEKLRKELEDALDLNEALWTEKNILTTANSHMNETIEEYREIIEELNLMTQEEGEEEEAEEDGKASASGD